MPLQQQQQQPQQQQQQNRDTFDMHQMMETVSGLVDIIHNQVLPNIRSLQDFPGLPETQQNNL